MSHFTVVVCLDDLGKLAEALAPFDENTEMEPYRSYEDGGPAEYWAVEHLREKSGLNPDDTTLTWQQVADAYTARYGPEDALLVDESGRAYTMSTYNPESKWDWYQVGGRWGGYFRIKPGFEGRVITPKREWNSPEIIMANTCDGGPKLALDLDGMREAKAAEARETYAKWLKVVDGTPEALPWRVFAENISAIEGYTIDDARREYGSQPRVQAIKASDLDPFMDCAIETYQKPERLFVELARAQAVPGYAVLTLDGKWMAPGRMGWFGMSSDGESERAGYWEVANAYLDSLPDSTWLVLVDCHI